MDSTAKLNWGQRLRKRGAIREEKNNYMLELDHAMRLFMVLFIP